MESMRLSDHCYAVTGLGYMSPWCVNAGFIVGDEMTLVVDTGGNTLAAQSIHGYACAARPGNKLRVINTEKHFDHIGGNGYFRELGIEVWGHAGIARTPDEFQAEIAEFNDAIPDPVRRARVEARAFFYRTNPTNPNCPIHSDITFDLGGMKVEILLTPGHTPTNLSVWVAEDGVLYTGDCVVREYLPNLDAGCCEDWQLWLDSLDRIEQLKPGFVVSGHGPVSRGDEIPAALDSVRKVLRESIARGFSPTSRRPG
ncbi:MAG TPA: MBL fold metallo-hydrolase [Terracidiphilus sp.]|nr:MBL fold metallo-hydrolase [Terracidiphilus sp.]